MTTGTESSRNSMVLPVLFGAVTLGLVSWGLIQLAPERGSDADTVTTESTEQPKVAENGDEVPSVIETPAVEEPPLVVPTEGRFADLIARSGIDRDLAAERDVLAFIEEYWELLDFRDDLEKHRNYKANRAELEEYLASLPPEMVPLLLELLEKEEDFVHRYILIEALGEIGSDLAADGLVRHIDYMYEIDNSSEIRRLSLALGRVDSDHSFDLLHELIDRDATAVEAINRYRFVEQLGEHSRRGEATDLFLDLVENEGHPKMRDTAAAALKKAKDWQTAPAIERSIRMETSPYVKQTLIGALASIGDRSSLSTLADIAKTDDNDSSRASAVEAIYRIGGPEAEQILSDIAKTEKDAKIKARAERRIKKLRDGD